MVIQTSFFLLLFFFFKIIIIPVSGFGSPGPIAAAFGENGFFCAVDAGGKQEIICWGKNSNESSATSASPNVNSLHAMAALSGGEGFLCGITSNTSQVYCWALTNTANNLVPNSYKFNTYAQIAPGTNHVCAIRGSFYSRVDYGVVDCWELNQTSNNSLQKQPVNNAEFRSIVSGDGFSCGTMKNGEFICWGPKANTLDASDISTNTTVLVSGRGSICGISVSGELQCSGDAKDFTNLPINIRFVALSAGAHHFCGIREDDHGIECWGSVNASSIPKGSGFTAIASSDFTSCGIREADFVLDCWDVHGQSPPDYRPPLQLCSPGVCSPGSCSTGKFAFNASILNEPELTSLCVEKDLNICLPCGSNCSQGFFPSSVCSDTADRICTDCSLCQSSSCENVCRLRSSSSDIRLEEQREIKKLLIIIGSSVSSLMLVLIGWCVIPRLNRTGDQESNKNRFGSCIRKQTVEAEPNTDLEHAVSATSVIETAQVFRLSDLKDATNGFKEFNELGRGSYGFVYKATLNDGSHVAVKRANAATIIHTNSREFEAEVEILCNLRHGNIVNLLGYCAEMGERVLVYELMPHGTLHDHLHGDLSPLDWNQRLKIVVQAARGLEYLHRFTSPPIVHRDVKTANILLDSTMEARIADFGLLSVNERETNGDLESDVYNFGIVLLEILSGRKDYDRDYTPSGIVEWGLPLIRRGRAAAIVDRHLALPRNVEPLLKLADVAELALKENPSERGVIGDIVASLDLIVATGLTF